MPYYEVVVNLSVVVGLFVVTGTLCASTITLSFTQYFDYPAVRGHPAATWTALFDLGTHPTNPFVTSSPSLNADAIADGLLPLSGTPKIASWDGDKILSAVPVNTADFFIDFKFVDFVILAIDPFDHCSQPCIDTAVSPDFAFVNTQGPLHAQTPDVFSGITASIPEPSSFALMLLGMAVLGTIKRPQGNISTRSC